MEWGAPRKRNAPSGHLTGRVPLSLAFPDGTQPRPGHQLYPEAGDTGGQPKSPNLRSAHPLGRYHRLGGRGRRLGGRGCPQRRGRRRSRKSASRGPF